MANTYKKLKDPNAVKYYTLNWGEEWLGVGETISASTWTADAGITIESSSNTTTTTSVLVSGGTDGIQYKVTNRITTSLGQTEDQYLLVSVKNK